LTAKPGLSTLEREGVGEWFLNTLNRGAWVAQSVKRLPGAQVMIPGSWEAPRSAGEAGSPLSRE